MIVPLMRMAIVLVILDLFSAVLIGLATVRAVAWMARISKDRFEVVDGVKLFLASATIAFSVFAVSGLFLSWDLVGFQREMDKELQPIKQEFRLVVESRPWGFRLKGEERLLDFGGELDRVIQKRDQVLRDYGAVIWGDWMTRQGNGGSRNSVEFSSIYVPLQSFFGLVFPSPCPPAGEESHPLGSGKEDEGCIIFKYYLMRFFTAVM